MKETAFRRLVSGAIFCLALLGPAFADLTDDQKKTLASIAKVDDYPVYTMTYYGDYGFDEYLKRGIVTTRRPSAARPSASVRDGCSCFGALAAGGDKLYGRNLDLLKLYPVLIMWTDPPKGFASVSLNIAVEIELYLDNPTEEHIQWVLEYPYWCFDGMNEYGVAVSGLSVEGERVYDPDKITLGRYDMRRLILDYARTVDEAVRLVSAYNNQDSDTVHYLVSDAHGASAVIEYHDGAVNAHRAAEPWQAVTNFLLRGRPADSVLGLCRRYEKVYRALQAAGGRCDQSQGMEILKSVFRNREPAGDGAFVYTVWSAIYNMTTGDLGLCPGSRFDNLETAKLGMVRDLSVRSARAAKTTLRRAENAKFTARIVNASPRPSLKTTLKFYLAKGRKVGAGSVALGQTIVPALAANRGLTVAGKKRVPATAAPGAYRLIAVVDPLSRNNDPAPSNNTYVWTKTITVK
ncbi:MAG: linear amide C-N hydrolase [Candidatus Aminicenantes bacterium]|nr:linear amide C-N hydrolase [Candidatus Aminicenantes bacterium]